MTPPELERYLTTTTSADERALYQEILVEIGPARLIRFWALIDAGGARAFAECLDDAVRGAHPEHF